MNKLSDILSLDCFKVSLQKSMFLKMKTDSPNAGGVLLESNLEDYINNYLYENNHSVICFSNKGIQRTINEGYQFDFSLISASNFKEFKAKTKTSGSIASSADLFLFSIAKNKLILIDANSLKSSTSNTVGKIYLHNDADGSIYNGIISGNNPDIGQVCLLTFCDETGKTKAYSFSGKVSAITDLFESFKEENGQLVFHGKNFKGNRKLKKQEGANRQLLVVTNRKKKTKKKNGDDLLATSFTRGLTIYKGFLDVLAEHKVLKKICEFDIDYKKLDSENFKSCYKQLSKMEV